MNFARLREFFLAVLLDLFGRLKAERVQDRTIPGETPMTLERIKNRAIDAGFELLYAPVAIRMRYRRGNFEKAVAFVNEVVAWVAAEIGHSPRVEIDQGDVTVTLGVPIPALLSEADFDVADAIKETAAAIEAEAGTDEETEPADA